jgi:3-oxoacyl-[acyl-carrier-protein] synthase II
MNSDGRRRVVVTGMSAITGLGLTVDEFWDGLIEGRSAVGPITHFDTTGMEAGIAGEVRDFDPHDYMEVKEARRMSRFSQFAVAASRTALADAAIDLDKEDRTRVGVEIATGIGGLTDTEQACITMMEKGVDRISPFFVPVMLPNMGSSQAAMVLGLKGPNNTPVTACAAGNTALGGALSHIRDDDAEIMVAGGTEAAICRLGLAAFSAMRALSRRAGDPTKASRPFDANRDGFVAAEGCGVLVLEELEHARRRGARIYAELKGYGCSEDAYHVSAPDPVGEGAARAMDYAIKDSGLNPTDIDYISAHATSTAAGDAGETRSIKLALGEHAREIAISAPKSMLGHHFGAAGGVEAVATVLSIVHQRVHPTINLDTPDPECDLDYVPNQARSMHIEHAMSNSFGFGGQNAVVVFSRYHD